MCVGCFQNVLFYPLFVSPGCNYNRQTFRIRTQPTTNRRGNNRQTFRIRTQPTTNTTDNQQKRKQPTNIQDQNTTESIKQQIFKTG